MASITAPLDAFANFVTGMHWQSYATGIFLWTSYTVFSSVLQYVYYYSQRERPEDWKVAPKANKSLKHSHTWWHPLVNYWTSKERGPYHALIATVNLLMSCFVGAFVTEVRFLTLPHAQMRR